MFCHKTRKKFYTKKFWAGWKFLKTQRETSAVTMNSLLSWKIFYDLSITSLVVKSSPFAPSLIIDKLFVICSIRNFSLLRTVRSSSRRPHIHPINYERESPQASLLLHNVVKQTRRWSFPSSSLSKRSQHWRKFFPKLFSIMMCLRKLKAHIQHITSSNNEKVISFSLLLLSLIPFVEENERAP